MVTGQQILSTLASYAERGARLNHVQVRGEAKTFFTSAQALLAPVAAKETAIRADGTLNVKERKTELAKLLPNIHSALAGAISDKTRIDQRLDRLTRELHTLPLSANEPVLRQLKNAELRGIMRTLTQAERVSMLSEAVKTNDVNVLDAFTSAPDALVPREVQQRAVASWAESIKPSTWTEAEAVGEVAGALGALITQTHSWVRSLETE